MAEALTPDWRDTFCGRQAELARLLALYEDVAALKGPRLAVVLGDRGMGKTRLVQEFYRLLSTHHDPNDYWPDASLFAGQNLRVVPDLRDPRVRAHFESFALEDRPMPFLWWNFRLVDPEARNAARSDMAAHRTTLEVHLVPAAFARRESHARRAVSAAGKDLAGAVGKKALFDALKAVPGVGLAAIALDWALDLSDAGFKGAADVRRGAQRDEQERRSGLQAIEAQRLQDIQERTLDELTEILAPAKSLEPLPTVVFCDDAQFAGDGGDEGAFRFLTSLWERAHLAGWPLLLVLTHWAVEWHQRVDDEAMPGATLARRLRRDAASPQFGAVIDLPAESALADLARAGLPGLAAADITLLLRKADGNPQVLLELVDLMRRKSALPAWRQGNALTAYARRQIDDRSTKLVGLIKDRLESDVTPGEVRSAVALSSLQGLEFVCALTHTVADVLSVQGSAIGLNQAQHPHRLIAGVDQGVAGFVQRAYYEAAASLVGDEFGDPAEVQAVMLTAAVDLRADADRWLWLKPSEQEAALGVVVNLSEAHPDPVVRAQAGHALLDLIERAMQSRSGADFARAAELAVRFESGLDARWTLSSFPLGRVDAARRAQEVWFGLPRSLRLAQAMVDLARELVHTLCTPESKRELWLSLDNLGRVAQAQGQWSQAQDLFSECLKIAHELERMLGTPQALQDLARSFSRLGQAAAGIDHWPKAEVLCSASLLNRREVARKLGTPEAQRDVSTSLSDVARIAEAQGQRQQAESLYSESLEMARQLARSTGTPDVQRDLMLSLQNVGRLKHGQGDLVQAEALYREGLEIARQMASALGTPRARADLSVLLNCVGQVAWARGEGSQADALCLEGLEIARELVRVLGTPESLDRLSESLDFAGGVSERQARWQDAEALFEESLVIRCGLTRVLDTPFAQRAMAASLDNVGRVAEAQGKLLQAEALYREGLEIRSEQARNLDTPHGTSRRFAGNAQLWSIRRVARAAAASVCFLLRKPRDQEEAGTKAGHT